MTNQHGVLCHPFVGLNNLLNTMMFGMGFLSDETTKSFEWLFKTFLISMKGKQPKAIFTDQSMSIMNAIDNTFTSAKHRLCQWHINRNSTSYFGKLNGNREFKKLWFECMNHCETAEDFEARWFEMIVTYGLSDH